MMATDLADYLAAKIFRFVTHAWQESGPAAAERNLSLAEMPLEAYQAIGPFEADVYQVYDPLKSIQKRNAIGGTSLQSVKNQIAKCRKNLQT
jgi:argininosuccinate lyase